MPTAFSSLLFRDYSSIFLLLLTNPGMRSDVHVVLLGLLLIQRSWQAENFDKSPRNHDSRENPRVANGNHRIEETLTNRSGKVLNQKRKPKPTTYNLPPDEVYRRDRIWLYLDSPLNQIPIPRAPTPTFGEVVPRPQVWYKNYAYYKVSSHLHISIHGPSNYILKKAVSRYERLVSGCNRLSTFSRRSIPRDVSDEEIDKSLMMDSLAFFKSRLSKSDIRLYGPVASDFALFPPCPARSLDSIDCLQIVVRRLGDFWPSAEMNETYSLVVEPSGVKILADEVWGAIRALETFSQLLWCSPSGSSVFINQTFINDFPSFSYRGLHLDTSRHYISKRNILVNLEAMAFNKLNVFHWHISDDQSFPFASKTFPELYKKAAYHPKMVYTHEDIREIIEFARVRGIRIIPEFDIPGHTRAWAYAHPEIFSKCYDSDEESPFYGPLDLTKNETFDLLVKFFKEIVELFPESYLHMGYDEVEFNCLESNPQVQLFLSNNQMTNSIEAIKLFTVRLLNSIQELARNYSMTRGKRFIFWQEAFDSGLKLPNNSIIHVWKDLNFILEYFGYQSVISKGWYLDSYTLPSDWINYYENYIGPPRYRPDVFSEHEPKGAIGGEACMWNEWQSDETVIQHIWPVASAIAERLWYYGSPNTDEFAPRLEELRCRLLRRGIPAGVAGGPGSCPLPANADISPPLGIFEGDSIDSFIVSRYVSCLEASSTIFVFFFYGVVLFIFGYVSGRVGFVSRFYRVAMRLSSEMSQFRCKSRPFICRKFLAIGLLTFFFAFIGILLLFFFANLGRLASNPGPVD